MSVEDIEMSESFISSYQYNGDFSSSKTQSELTGYSKKFSWKDKFKDAYVIYEHDYNFQLDVEERHLQVSFDSNFTVAPDGSYPLCLNQYNWYKSTEDADLLSWYSSSKVIVRSNLFDLESLIQCSREILLKCGYHGSFIEGVDFIDGLNPVFKLEVGS